MRRGNGEGSIITLSGKRRKPYAVRVTVGWTLEGKQKYKYVGYYEKKSEANKALREYLVNPYDLSTVNTTMLDVFKKWEESSELAPVTMRGYKSAFNQALHLHKRKVREVRIAELEDAMHNLKPSMQASFKNMMNQLYKYAIKYEIADKNLSEFLTPQKVDHKQRKPFTAAQIEQIKGFNHKYNDIVIILLYTGFRINELLEMKKENVNLKDRYFYGGKKTVNGKTRYTPIHDAILPTVERYYNSNKEYLFEHKDKKIAYRTFMTVYWERLKEHLGTDHTPHCTRHTFITQADKCGLNKTKVKKIVGHASSDVTDHYTHTDIQELLAEINKLKY